MRSYAITLLLAIFCCHAVFTTAQTADPAPTRYHVLSYIKVAPGKHAEYLKLEQAWKKIHAAKKKAGRLEGWALLDILAPSGASKAFGKPPRNQCVFRSMLALNASDKEIGVSSM